MDALCRTNTRCSQGNQCLDGSYSRNRLGRADDRFSNLIWLIVLYSSPPRWPVNLFEQSHLSCVNNIELNLNNMESIRKAIAHFSSGYPLFLFSFLILSRSF